MQPSNRFVEQKAVSLWDYNKTLDPGEPTNVNTINGAKYCNTASLPLGPNICIATTIARMNHLVGEFYSRILELIESLRLLQRCILLS